jgi:hypothetical protein
MISRLTHHLPRTTNERASVSAYHKRIHAPSCETFPVWLSRKRFQARRVVGSQHSCAAATRRSSHQTIKPGLTQLTNIGIVLSCLDLDALRPYWAAKRFIKVMKTHTQAADRATAPRPGRRRCHLVATDKIQRCYGLKWCSVRASVCHGHEPAPSPPRTRTDGPWSALRASLGSMAHCHSFRSPLSRLTASAPAHLHSACTPGATWRKTVRTLVPSRVPKGIPPDPYIMLRMPLVIGKRRPDSGQTRAPDTDTRERLHGSISAARHWSIQRAVRERATFNNVDVQKDPVRGAQEIIVLAQFWAKGVRDGPVIQAQIRHRGTQSGPVDRGQQVLDQVPVKLGLLHLLD